MHSQTDKISFVGPSNPPKILGHKGQKQPLRWLSTSHQWLQQNVATVPIHFVSFIGIASVIKKYKSRSSRYLVLLMYYSNPLISFAHYINWNTEISIKQQFCQNRCRTMWTIYFVIGDGGGAETLLSCHRAPSYACAPVSHLVERSLHNIWYRCPSECHPFTASIECEVWCSCRRTVWTDLS